MRILLTTHQFLPESSAGTEVLTFEVARELQRRGHDVRVMSGSPNFAKSAQSRCDDYLYQGIAVRRIRAMSLGTLTPAEIVRNEYDDPHVAHQFDSMLTEWRPDLVHFFHLQRLTGSIVRRCVDLGIPTVYTPTDFWAICPLNQLRLPDGSLCNGPSADSSNCILHLSMTGRHVGRASLYRWIPDDLPGRLLRLMPEAWITRSKTMSAARQLQKRAPMARELLQKFDRILPATEAMARTLQANGAPQRSMQTIAYGIDQTNYGKFRPIGQDAGLNIGFVGALNASKGAHILLEAASRIGTGTAFTIAVYGDTTSDPDYFGTLQVLAARDARIHFHGTFDRAKFPEVLDSLDVLVVPSVWVENMPLVALSALTAGRPVIGSNVSGISEIVRHGVNGYLFNPGDSTTLAAILQSLISDRQQLNVLSVNSKPAVTIEQYVDRLETNYEMISKENAPTVN